MQNALISQKSASAAKARPPLERGRKKNIAAFGFATSERDYVPCLFLPSLNNKSRQLIIYFHGNGEDLGTIYTVCDHLRTALNLNLLAVEYPDYGIYEDPEGPSEEKILSDAELVYNFVQDVVKLKEKDIFVMGRSLGSGPSTHLAAKFNPGCLILVSPYTSIKSVASDKVGFLSHLLAQQFDNLSKMHSVTCPTFILHG